MYGETVNATLRTYFLQRVPEYIKVVPNHWLEQDQPLPDVQFYVAVTFLIICIPANISELLVILAYVR